MSVDSQKSSALRRHCWAVTLLLGWCLAAEHRVALAQEPSGLQAALALEKALVDTIAKNKKSIVAIARVEKSSGGNAISTVEIGPGRFGVPQLAQVARPGDPDFVPNSFGTGVVVSKQGLILTAYHVLGENSEHWVTTPDRRTYLAKIKAADPRSDLAILEIEASDLVPITYGDGGKLEQGQIVIALGNPYAIARDGQASASWGIVSNIGRKAGSAPVEQGRSTKDKLYHYGTLIQTDAKLNLGTSGGAMVNLRGEMVGLTTSLAATPGYEQAAGYAIPVDETFRRVVDTLKQGREVEYGFLGVRPENLRDYELRRGLHGMRIGDVVRGTPAHRFDLRTDDVITHVNGQPIYDADGLVLNVGKLPVDAQVQLTVVRDGQSLKTTAELTKFPVTGKKIVTTPAPAWRGLRVDYVTVLADFQRRAGLGEIDPEGCVVVTEVEPGSLAEAAKIKSDMLISRVGNTPVRSPREFRTAVAESTGPVKLRIRGAGDPQLVTVAAP